MSNNPANASVQRQLAAWAELVDQTIIDLRRNQVTGAPIGDSRQRLAELLVATGSTNKRSLEGIVLDAAIARDTQGLDLKSLGNDLERSANTATLIARLEPLATALERKREQAAAKMMIR